MKRNYPTILLLFLYSGLFQIASGQPGKSVHGKVTDGNGNAIAGCSVFLSHTSKGITTSSSGEFHLQNLPDGKYDLVISAIGFETKVIPLSSGNIPDELKVTLVGRSTELQEVVVEPREKNGWRTYGQIFVDNFIGTTHNARFCKIKNPEVFRFRFSEKNNRLTAKANEPVIIENKILGYKISFQLVEFIADFNANVVAYYGYPLFSDINETSKKERSRIHENRLNAYYGSLMHFIRAVYSDNLKEEGFIIRATITRPNAEKLRVKKIVEQKNDTSRYAITQLSDGFVQVTSSNTEGNNAEDSLRYYRNIVKQKDTITETVALVSLNEMITNLSPYSKSLYFDNTMEVLYKTKSSEIKLQTPVQIEITKNGSYFPPTELVTFKYWSDQEKMCNMLPNDYYP